MIWRGVVATFWWLDKKSMLELECWYCALVI